MREWSADELPGEMQAIMTILLTWFLLWKESRRMRVSFEARKGTWSALSSIALMHSFSASRLKISHKVPLVDLGPLNSSLPIIALRILGSLAAGQIDQNQFPGNFIIFLHIDLHIQKQTWQMACDLDDVSLATVAWVVLLVLACSIIDSRSLAL